MKFLVDGVELAVLDVFGAPRVELVQAPRLALLQSDGEIEGGGRDLGLEYTRRILDADLVDDRCRRSDAVNLSGDGGGYLGGIVVIARDLQLLVLHVRQGRVLRGAARD